MLFSSMFFLWVFLPIVLLGNFLINICLSDNPEKCIKSKNIFLLIASLFFYAWGGLYYLFIMIFSILLNFAGGYLIDKYGNNPYYIVEKPKLKGFILFVVVSLNILVLVVFKYFNMIVATIEAILAGGGFQTVMSNIFSMQGTGSLNMPYIVLPIGISFFTFQSMSYVCDVYMGRAKVQRSLTDFALYVSLFPQLIAGPIVRYADIDAQLKYREETVDKFYEGIRRFIYGLSKKVLIANNLAVVSDQIFDAPLSDLSTPVAWLAAICYAFQIYYDFSGYSDMAIGLGLMFGFRFRENFNYPYTSLSVQDFWRRWHISLSTWFKEYVYIPLGGSRCGNLITIRNTFIVFFLTGLWHGANWTFIMWGLSYAVLLTIERLFLKKVLVANKFKALNWFYAFFITVILCSLFRSNNINFFFGFFKTMFIYTEGEANLRALNFITAKCFYALLFGFLLSGHLQKIFIKPVNKNKNKPLFLSLEIVFMVCLFVICVFSLVSGTYNPFIYFQF